ncbi:MAG: hypothetical protein QNJ35_03190 [Paracoccaceae bacterium]|nr:hypothetical protein [Paracoccaceae bacterium]
MSLTLSETSRPSRLAEFLKKKSDESVKALGRREASNTTDAPVFRSVRAQAKQSAA